MRLLMSVYRDADRRQPVVGDTHLASEIITRLLGVTPSEVRSAAETHARDDYWVEVDRRTVKAQPSWQYAGTVDIVSPGGRIVGVPAPEESS